MTALFFLACFTGCIAVNCAKNIGILMAWEKNTHTKTPVNLSISKSDNASTVYFLMDKKENEVQKDLSGHLLPPASFFRYPLITGIRPDIVFKAGRITPIYTEIHNYRI
ncbi:MAG: hypothetical protein ACXVPN_04315 [Bacteroidia bacterium]